MSNPNERYTKLVIWLVFIVCLASNVLAILGVAIAKHENIIDQAQLDRSLMLLLAFMIIQFVGFFSLHFDYSFHYTLATFVLCTTVQITLIVMSVWHHFLILAAISYPLWIALLLFYHYTVAPVRSSTGDSWRLAINLELL